MKKKQIIVNYPGRRGGGAAYAYEMTKSLIENGCNVVAIVSSEIENKLFWKQLPLDDFIMLPTYSNQFNFFINSILFRVFGIKELKKRLQNKSIDVVYVPMIQPWTGLINSIFPKSQIIITLHDPVPHPGMNWVLKRKYYKVAKNSDDIVILSEKFRKITSEKYSKDHNHIHHIPHGPFASYKDMADENLFSIFDDTKINFLFFGRITKYKGLKVLAEAYRKLSNDVDNVSLSVVGSGDFDEYKEYYTGLKDFNLINRWIRDEEVGNYFKGKNIITVCPYNSATQSGVIPLAMANNSLVIASDIGGLSEQVIDKITGYLFTAGDSKSLYSAMKYVVEHINEQDEIIKNASSYIQSLSWKSLGKRIIEIIDQ